MRKKRPDLKAEMTSLTEGTHTRALGREAADRARRAAESFVADGQRVSGMAAADDGSVIIIERSGMHAQGARGRWATAH